MPCAIKPASVYTPNDSEHPARVRVRTPAGRGFPHHERVMRLEEESNRMTEELTMIDATAGATVRLLNHSWASYLQAACAHLKSIGQANRTNGTHALVSRVGSGPRPPTRLLPDATEQDGLPDGLGQHLARAVLQAAQELHGAAA